MMTMMKMCWMQISIVYRHLDLWPGCEKGKWYLLHMITTQLLYTRYTFLGGFFHILGKAARFSLHDYTALSQTLCDSIVFATSHVCSSVVHDFLENIWSAGWLQRSDRGKTRGTLLPVIYDSGLTKGYHEHQSRWLHEDCLFCINVNVNTSQVL